jgi:hypothetical protein
MIPGSKAIQFHTLPSDVNKKATRGKDSFLENNFEKKANLSTVPSKMSTSAKTGISKSDNSGERIFSEVCE